MEFIVGFLIFYLAIIVANGHKNRETNVEDEKREEIVSYISSCLADSHKDFAYDELIKEDTTDYLACIYKSISLDDAYVQKSIKGCLGPDGLHEIKFLISAMREGPIIHDLYLSNHVNCLAKQLKTVSETVETGVAACFKENNINEGILVNKQSASPEEKEKIKKYYECMKVKLGDKHEEIYSYIVICPEEDDNYAVLFDQKNISSFQHEKMDTFGPCLYNKLGYDNRMIVKYITDCFAPSNEDSKSLEEIFKIGITEALDINDLKVSNVNGGAMEPALKCIYNNLWNDVKLLIKYVEECLGDSTYDEVEGMFTATDEAQSEPRNNFLACIRDKLKNTTASNARRPRIENQTDDYERITTVESDDSEQTTTETDDNQQITAETDDNGQIMTETNNGDQTTATETNDSEQTMTENVD